MLVLLDDVMLDDVAATTLEILVGAFVEVVLLVEAFL